MILGRARHRLMGDFQQPVALGLIADLARNVETGRIRRDNGIAAFEQEARRDGGGLARLGGGGHLHQQPVA